MKTIKFYLGILFILPFFLIGCEDDSGSTPIAGSIIPPTAQEFNALKGLALQNLTQTYSLEVDDTGMVQFTSAQGVIVTIYPYCLTFGGENIEGGDVLDIEFIELYNRGNLLTTNIATMGKHSNGDLEMLVTGGAFYINITHNGLSNDNDYCGYSMQIPASNTGGIDEDMILWFGNFDEDGNLVWEEANGEQGQGGEFWMDDDTYNIWANQFGWTNVDRFYNDPRPKTTILVDVPNGYDSSNCAVYLSYNGELGLARLDTFDEDTGYFSEHYGLIPIGLECHVIFVSEHNGQWVYTIKPVTIEENGVIEILQSDLNTTSESNLTNLINALP